MPAFQWYSRSDRGLLVGIPLYASAFYFSFRLLDHHPLISTVVFVLGFQVADWLNNRTPAWFSPGQTESNDEPANAGE
ncbi:MAG TPA: hypothetical protein VL132_11950 [Planctomycetaceae bacterium]|nr:hypothetical protein [Planctomycetaceae bacterium]